MTNLVYSLKTTWFLILVTILVSCSQGPNSGVDLQIISIKPEPIVGQVATVIFTITSNYSTSATISTRLFDTAIGYYPEPQTLWEGSLVADESQEFLWTICVLNPGRWQLDIGVITPEKLGDGEQRFIESDFAGAEVARYFEEPAEVTRLATVISTENASTHIPPETEEVIISTSTPEPPTNLSQECLTADSLP